MSGGKLTVPLVLRTNLGATRRSAAQHSQSLQALVAHIPGLKVALPSSAYEAKGLMKTAIRDNNPVVIFEDKLMYQDKAPVPEEEYLIPFGEANVKREGSRHHADRHVVDGAGLPRRPPRCWPRKASTPR
jgi:pyruvate/2-oxoglutarate/acetoin dehydrogenase E1 component